MEECTLDMMISKLTGDVENLDDGGNKSRLGLKIKSVVESNLLVI